MKKLKKFLCLITSSVILFGIFSVFSIAASGTITDIEILTMPEKTFFVKDEDWIYGLWDINESTGEVFSITSEKISFTHNAGSGIYPERGMLDMTGLSVRVSYSDGSSKTVKYTETKNSKGIYIPNILASPAGGYSVGTNTIEIYFSENTKVYTSYEIEISETDPYEQLTSENAVVDYKAFYITNLSAGLTRTMLESGIFDFGDASVTFTKAQKSSRYYGTGSTMTLTHKNGTVETFTFVIPGDIDGNGIVNFDDASIADSAVADNSILTQAQSKAAEVDGMRRITANDVALIIKMINE